jgi:hypothetical protein
MEGMDTVKLARGVERPSRSMHHYCMRWHWLFILLLGGCASSSVSSLGPVALYRVASDGVTLERVERLDLPNRSDLIIRPQWFSGALATVADSDDPARIQAQFRFLRADGVDQRFFVTGDNSDPFGFTERVSSPSPSGRYTHSMSGRRYGPIDAFETVFIEIMVAQVEPSSGGGTEAIGGPVGVMALRQAPPMQCLSAYLLRRAERQVESVGGQLELAVRIPVQANTPRVERVVEHRLIFVEVEPGGNTEDALDKVARLLSSGRAGVPPIGDASGRLIEGVSAFAFILQVGEHVPKKPKQEKPRDPNDERIQKPLKVGQGVLR